MYPLLKIAPMPMKNPKDPPVENMTTGNVRNDLV